MNPDARSPNFHLLYDNIHAFAYIPNGKTNKDFIDLSKIIDNMT